LVLLFCLWQFDRFANAGAKIGVYNSSIPAKTIPLFSAWFDVIQIIILWNSSGQVHD